MGVFVYFIPPDLTIYLEAEQQVISVLGFSAALHLSLVCLRETKRRVDALEAHGATLYWHLRMTEPFYV